MAAKSGIGLAPRSAWGWGRALSWQVCCCRCCSKPDKGAIFSPRSVRRAFRGAPSQAGGGVLPNAFSPCLRAIGPAPARVRAPPSPPTGPCACVCAMGFISPSATPKWSRAMPSSVGRAAGARLFYHPIRAAASRTMDLTGRACSALPTAFKYRQTLVAGCLADRHRYPQRPARSGPRRGAGRLDAWAADSHGKRQFPARLRRVRPGHRPPRRCRARRCGDRADCSRPPSAAAARLARGRTEPAASGGVRSIASASVKSSS